MTEREPQFWVNTISLEHVTTGIAEGFTQADHGKPDRLRKLHEGDWMVFYSPRTAMRSGEPVQQFTALGRITGDPIYQVSLTPDFHPWRRNIDFTPSVPADIRPLLPKLTFTRNHRNWGIIFRRGLFEIPAADFDVITQSMQHSPS